MGAAFTQRPDLFRAVVSYVGIYDMLRVELDPNGAFNVTEFGTVKDPDQFKALYAYSPYHHVKDGTAYPAILFLTGENDHRVNPMQSRKMTARLQAANSSGHPILLRTTASAGHGIGTALDEQIEEDADCSAFCLISWESSTPRRENETRLPDQQPCFSVLPTWYKLLLTLHRRPALPVQLEQMSGVLLRLRRRARALKAYAGRSRSPVPRGHRDEFHQIERDILIAARARVQTWTFIHKSFS